MVRDDTALTAAFGGALRRLDIVNCPGNIQSPGPWHSNAAPQKRSSTLIGGFPRWRANDGLDHRWCANPQRRPGQPDWFNTRRVVPVVVCAVVGDCDG
jgi:hypothetical protein